MGIIIAGSAVGAVIAPPASAAIIAFGGCRWVFFISGATGLIWAVWWMQKYVPPLESVSESTPQGEQAGQSWFQLFAFRQTWGLVVGKFLSDACADPPRPTGHESDLAFKFHCHPRRRSAALE
jgi:ACS family hexuronate transporter-like MFS transporter